MPRLFTALEVPAPVATALALIRGGLSGARWIDAENFHVTLRFIGDVDGAMARDIDATLAGIARPGFSLVLDGLAAFGGAKPRAIVATVAQNAALTALQAEQERLLRRIGLGPETRKYVPHVTLARLRGTGPLAVADFLALHGFLPLPPFPVRRFVLLSSRGSVGGGPYVTEAAYPLV